MHECCPIHLRMGTARITEGKEYPELPKMQAETEPRFNRFPVEPRLHRFILCTRSYRGLLPMRVEGATGQLDLPSLTPLSAAGCGRLQPHRVTSVDYCE